MMPALLSLPRRPSDTLLQEFMRPNTSSLPVDDALAALPLVGHTPILLRAPPVTPVMNSIKDISIVADRKMAICI